MAKNKHTLGPWKVEKPYYKKWQIYSANHPVGRICEMDDRDDYAEANAAFIVQAVNSHAELLAACEIILSIWEFPEKYPRKPDRDLHQDIRTIVAKAKGD